MHFICFLSSSLCTGYICPKIYIRHALSRKVTVAPRSQTNRNVLSAHLNRSVDKSAERREDGRLFQILAPATVKLRSPNVLLVRRTTNIAVFDDRSLRRPESAMSWLRWFVITSTPGVQQRNLVDLRFICTKLLRPESEILPASGMLCCSQSLNHRGRSFQVSLVYTSVDAAFIDCIHLCCIWDVTLSLSDTLIVVLLLWHEKVSLWKLPFFYHTVSCECPMGSVIFYVWNTK